MEYYQSIFPNGDLEKQGEYTQGKYCGICIQINDEGKARRIHITDGLPQIPALIESEDFSMIAPILFAGKQASKANARWLQAIEFDLDFIRENENGECVGLSDLLYQCSITETDPFNRLPRPTYIIASSYRNLHIVYLLEKPLAMYPNVIEQVRRFRKAFIPKLWDSYITSAYKVPQYETSPVQAFRLVGSHSKRRDERVRCFKVGEAVSIETLNKYVSQSEQITDVHYKSNYTLEETKKLFPQWYQKRIVEGVPAYSWKANRGLYDWWKSRVSEVEVGHRYHYLLCLCSYGVKCGISQDEITHDVFELRSILDAISPPDNPLTRNDASKALQAFNEQSRTMTRETISNLSGLKIEASKRNGRKQSAHIRYMNSIRQFKISEGETSMKNAGRKPKKDLVIDFYLTHPEMSNREIAHELGVNRSTVNKWVKYAKENLGQVEEKREQ